MEPMRCSFFADYLFPGPHTRRGICGRGERPIAFTPENCFGAGAKQVFCWFQSQAGLAIQPLFGLGFRLRWSGSAVEGLSVFGYGLAARARVLSVLTRVLSVLTRVLSVLTRVLSVLTRVLSMNLGESARIGKFGKRHQRVFHHSRYQHSVTALADIAYNGKKCP